MRLAIYDIPDLTFYKENGEKIFTTKDCNNMAIREYFDDNDGSKRVFIFLKFDIIMLDLLNCKFNEETDRSDFEKDDNIFSFSISEKSNSQKLKLRGIFNGKNDQGLSIPMSFKAEECVFVNIDKVNTILNLSAAKVTEFDYVLECFKNKKDDYIKFNVLKK
ncbi:hypothetical protein [Metaclostridioides mangenotii]|uniref:hypothetical protein n=1 Tax=Metaclostridioides mangenotii TaxID=1540 RepID=UPI000465463A|nr:hypothetical protein [Clostridioides mangenotii]